MGIMLKLSTQVKKISQVPLNVKALLIIFFDFNDEISTFDRFLKRNTTWQICVAFVKQFGKNVQNCDKELVQQKGPDQKGFKIKKIIFHQSSILQRLGWGGRRRDEQHGTAASWNLTNPSRLRRKPTRLQNFIIQR